MRFNYSVFFKYSEFISFKKVTVTQDIVQITWLPLTKLMKEDGVEYNQKPFL